MNKDIIINEIINKTDTYRVMKEIMDNISVSDFFNLLSEEDFQVLNSNLNNCFYKIFAVLIEKNSTEFFNCIINNNYLFNLFVDNINNYYSMLPFFNNVQAYRILKKCEDNNISINSIIYFNEEVMNSLLNSDLNDNTIILLLNNVNLKMYEKFVNENPRVYSLINDMPIRNVKFPQNIINSDVFQKRLFDVNPLYARKSINKFLSTNPSIVIYNKYKEYELNMINDLYLKLKNDDNLDYNTYSNALINLDEYIIDYLFEDNKNNVQMNIDELMRYNQENRLIEDDEIYVDYIYFLTSDIDDKINFFMKYKDLNIHQKFYQDLRLLKDHVYNNMNNIIVKIDDNTEIDEKLSNKNGVDVIDFRNEEFYMLVKKSDNYRQNTNTKRSCYSLISNNNTNVYESGGTYLYGYNDVDINYISHTLEQDSYSVDTKEDDLTSGSNFINRIMEPEDLVNKSYMYSEINILNEKNDDDSYNAKKPDYLICLDSNEVDNNFKIGDEDIWEAKRLNIPIVVIKNRINVKTDGDFRQYVDEHRYR